MEIIKKSIGIIMLATNAKRGLAIHKAYDNNDLAMFEIDEGEDRDVWTPQHLYFYDKTAKITENCWMTNGLELYYNAVKLDDYIGLYKVVATTDPNLKIKDFHELENSAESYLPHPSKDFVMAFIRKKGISTVLVEYEVIDKTESKIKVDKYGEITIHRKKERWSKNEVEQLLFNLAEYYGGTSSKADIDAFNTWMQKNFENQ